MNNLNYQIIDQIVDNAMITIERYNRSVKDVLPKDYAKPVVDSVRLGQLIERTEN